MFCVVEVRKACAECAISELKEVGSKLLPVLAEKNPDGDETWTKDQGGGTDKRLFFDKHSGFLCPQKK